MSSNLRKISNIRELDEFAALLLSSLTNSTNHTNFATVLALQGDLGAGKTAFVKSLGKELSISDNVTSPTFVIMKLFDVSNSKYKKLIHIDAYRLDNEKELEVLGWREIIKDPKNLVAIEWPERVEGLIPSSAIRIKFEFVDEETRNVAVELGDKRYE